MKKVSKTVLLVIFFVILVVFAIFALIYVDS